MRVRYVLVASAISLSGIAVGRGQDSGLDYPQWRGLERDGSASSFSEPAFWPDELTLRWRIEVGEGYATPIVVDDTVYTFTEQNGQEVMTALEAETGQELWQAGYAPQEFTPTSAAAAHGTGPKATPVFCEGRLVTLGITGVVAAFDTVGEELLWRTEEAEEHPFFSAAASPACDGGVVVTHPGNYGPLTAYVLETGEVLWTAGEGGFFQAPLIADLEGVRQVVAVDTNNVIGVSLFDGEVLWQQPWEGGRAGGSMPVLYNGSVIVSALDRGVMAFRPMRRDEDWVTETLWETRDVSMYTSNPVVIGDTLFGLSYRNSGQFFALDAATGETLWLGMPREADNTAVVKAGDLLFLLNDDAELIVARSSREGLQPLRRYTLANSATWAQPAISGNRLFVKDTRSLALWTLD